MIERILIALGLAFTQAVAAEAWTAAAEVRHELQRCVSYRARLQGEYLMVQAVHEPNWHTFAMDNKQRAEEKLAGRQSLGVDRSTEIRLSEGLETAGPWHQSLPKDISKPELRYFSWAFEGQTVFVAKVKPTGAGPAQIAIRGQACSESICKNIDLEISVPLGTRHAKDDPVDLKTLVQVQ